MSITLNGTTGIIADNPATVKANAYLDAAGGNTATINGAIPAPATSPTLTTPIISGNLGAGGANYGTSGQVLTSGGTGASPSWETLSTAPTTEQVGTATAGLTAGAVGSYALLARATTTTTTIVEGTTLAGSDLRYSGVVAAATTNSAVASPLTASAVVPPGTWRAMGSVLGTTNIWRLTLWLRIS